MIVPEIVRLSLFSIVVLTYNRKDTLSELLDQLVSIDDVSFEIIVVNNGSNDNTEYMVRDHFPQLNLVSLRQNEGAVARNYGMDIAKGKYIITLDDDILGLDGSDLLNLGTLFESNTSIGAICFKVVDFYSGNICNWCHPYRLETFHDQSFETTEITEGAVAFRKEVLQATGLYTKEFFISHEGSDLAARIIDSGYEVHYTPEITVSHKYAPEARDSWRRYYYDTRNSVWLAVRNYPFFPAASFTIKRILVMFLYSIRDGYVRYWIKAIKDTITELPLMLEQRKPITMETFKKMRSLDRKRPGFLYFLRRRLFSRQVRI